MKKKKITEAPFTVTSRNAQLIGMSHCAGHDKALIMCHGFKGNKMENKRLFVEAAREFAGQVCDVYRFDFYGSGDSEGEFEETKVSINIENLKDVLNYVSAKDYPGGIAVLGISMGAATAILTASELDIKALVLWSSVPDMHDVFEEKIRELGGNAPTGQEVFDYGGWLVRIDFVQDALQFDVKSALADIAIPKFILQGTADNPVFVQGFHQFRDIVQPPADFMEIPDAGHTYQTPNHRRQAIRQTLIWLQRHF